jgi:hypothetical protein
MSMGSVYFFAPLKSNLKGELYILKSIEIKDSVSTVFAYMGNSANANIWSVYIDHIRLISGEDGKKNCKRRCFKNNDENGMPWDEEIVDIVPNVKRVLSIYNGKYFPIFSENLSTEQLYINKGSKSELCLVLTLKGNQSLMEKFKFKLASFIVGNVFVGNLKNIKKEIEKQ